MHGTDGICQEKDFPFINLYNHGNMTIDKRKKHMDEKVPAGKFKAECLRLMEKVRTSHRNIFITKRNVPIAKLVPIEEKQEHAFGKLKGTVLFKGDIITSIDEVWNATT